MKKIITVVILFLLFSNQSARAQHKNNSQPIWTFTYLKAHDHQKEKLKLFIERNWFVMDSIAVVQKLLGQYELYENTNPEPTDWDFIVAVEYLSAEGYSAIAKAFEAIRSKHTEVKTDGAGLRELGKIVKSETVTKTQYLVKKR